MLAKVSCLPKSQMPPETVSMAVLSHQLVTREAPVAKPSEVPEDRLAG